MALRKRIERLISVVGSALLICLAASLLAYGQTPSISTGGTVNAADYTRTFAPGAIIAIFGSNFATSAQQAKAFPLPTSLGGASVSLVSTGETFPLWYASGTQINAQLPFDVPLGSNQVRVTTAAGVSNTDTITVSAQAPKIFTTNLSGAGSAVVTNSNYQILTTGVPVNPGDTIILWMNSLGATSGNPVAGQPAPGTTAGSQTDNVSGVTVTINGQNAPVSFAGLSPGSSGLYQVNVQAPFVTITGPLTVAVSVAGSTSQAGVTVPYQQLGFYYSLLGGKSVAGQTLNGVSGSSSALAFQQSDAIAWGSAGLNAWTNNTGLGSSYSAVTGLAVTLLNGSTVVYDNNGIETGGAANFYNNTGGSADSQKPGLSDLYSMSNYFPLVFGGYFTLTQATTVTQLIGYFDALGSTALPFNPANPFVRYRMNIWSNVSGNLPDETSNMFTGNVFSSDTTAGTFSYSVTPVQMVSSITTNAPKPIYRLSYVLAAPLTLPAGSYWFSHDVAVRSQPATTSTSATPLSLEEFRHVTESQRQSQGDPMHFMFYGREMIGQDSWTLPEPVVVRPSAVIEHQ